MMMLYVEEWSCLCNECKVHSLLAFDQVLKVLTTYQVMGLENWGTFEPLKFEMMTYHAWRWKDWGSGSVTHCTKEPDLDVLVGRRYPGHTSSVQAQRPIKEKLPRVDRWVWHVSCGQVSPAGCKSIRITSLLGYEYRLINDHHRSWFCSCKHFSLNGWRFSKFLALKCFTS